MKGNSDIKIINWDMYQFTALKVINLGGKNPDSIIFFLNKIKGENTL